MSEDFEYITPPTNSFAGLPVCTRLDELAADIAVIGTQTIRVMEEKGVAAVAEFIRSLG